MVGANVLDMKVSSKRPELTKLFDQHGHPLFWQEAKPISFWAAVYSAYNIGFVFDLSAGPGAQAIAAAQVGIAYRGVRANEKHMKRLNSLLEHAILAVEATSKTGK